MQKLSDVGHFLNPFLFALSARSNNLKKAIEGTTTLLVTKRVARSID